MFSNVFKVTQENFTLYILMDEVLGAVGDMEFRQKFFDIIYEMGFAM
ncbi:MAG: hypothetical protein Q8M95_03225 [Candidatus Methanoperedens sp.]|nr:hypothetical protein [Candidatus Methanoperedens sp.]